jgi:hypothetical protein
MTLEYTFDRLLGTKLARVCAILVPARTRLAGEPTGLRGETDEDRRHLCSSVLGSAEGRE